MVCFSFTFPPQLTMRSRWITNWLLDRIWDRVDYIISCPRNLQRSENQSTGWHAPLNRFKATPKHSKQKAKFVLEFKCLKCNLKCEGSILQRKLRSMCSVVDLLHSHQIYDRAIAIGSRYRDDKMFKRLQRAYVKLLG